MREFKIWMREGSKWKDIGSVQVPDTADKVVVGDIYKIVAFEQAGEYYLKQRIWERADGSKFWGTHAEYVWHLATKQAESQKWHKEQADAMLGPEKKDVEAEGRKKYGDSNWDSDRYRKDYGGAKTGRFTGKRPELGMGYGMKSLEEEEHAAALRDQARKEGFEKGRKEGIKAGLRAFADALFSRAKARDRTWVKGAGLEAIKDRTYARTAQNFAETGQL